MKHEEHGQLVMFGSLIMAFVAHVVFAVVLALLPEPEVAHASQRQPDLINLDEGIGPEPAPEPEPEPVEAAPEPEPEPEPETPRPRLRERRPEPSEVPERDPEPEETPPPEEEAPAEEPAALAEQVHDFSGQMLTGQGGDFAVRQASGQDSAGPLGNPVARTTGRDVAGRSDGAVGGMGTGAARPRVDRSRNPRPPRNLRAMLRRAYPRSAQQRGVGGQARFLLRINPDGSVTVLGPRGETPAGEGFASACANTLRRSRWQPPLNANGEPASRTVPFTCRFTVDR